MPRFFFPFPLGPAPEAEAPPPPPTPPFWTNLAASALNWNAVRAGVMPRFEHVYPQEPGAEQQWTKVRDPD